MNQFNYLPPEIIEFIFKKLELSDLINLRIVDKKFKEICDQIKIKKLVITDKLDISYSKFWFYTNNPTFINNENLIEFSKLVNYKLIFKLDKYLKRLSIRLNNNNFKISILNEFKLLEQLYLKIFDFDNDFKLNLENLKIAEIYPYGYLNSKLILNTNKLFAFKSDFGLDKFIFNYPDKILFYETDYVHLNDKIDIFKNLQFLKLIDTKSSIDILSKLKNLKIIDLNISIWIEEFEYDYLKKEINNLIEKKENLNLKDLQIYLQGVELINQNKINQLRWSSDYKEFKYNQLEFQIKNYDLLKDNCYENELNYCDLIKLIDKTPSYFFIKFPYIHQIKVNNYIDNEDQFIKFLNDLQYLSKLKLTNLKKNKSFYHKLINLVYLNNLIELEIKEEIDLELNFDFILNLNKLVIFETNQKVNNHIDLINKLFTDNQNIKVFEFKFDMKNYIEIFKRGRNLFEIKSHYYDNNLKKINNFPIKDLNLDNLILKLQI